MSAPAPLDPAPLDPAPLDPAPLDPDGLAPPAPEAEVAAIEARVGFALPGDYRAFLLRSDGYDGPVGQAGHAALWRARDVGRVPPAYEGEADVPGLLLTGSNGGPTAYGLLRGPAGAIVGWVSVPFVPMRPEEVRVLAPTFAGFLRALAAGEGW